MSKNVRIICLIIIYLVQINFITGCAVATLASMASMDSGFYEVKIPDIGKRQDILAIAEKVGNSMGYKVFGKSSNSITLKYETSMLATMTVGASSHYHITVSKSPELTVADPKMKKMSEELTIIVTAIGSYGKGGVSQAEKLANEFKAKILETIGQTHTG